MALPCLLPLLFFALFTAARAWTQSGDVAAILTKSERRGYHLIALNDSEEVTTLMGRSQRFWGPYHDTVVDIRNQTLFWSTIGSYSGIRSFDLQRQKSRHLGSKAGSWGSFLALDWVHGLLYWTYETQIRVANYHTRKKAIVTSSLERQVICSIATDPTRSLLYYGTLAQFRSPNQTKGIYRAGLDGWGVILIVNLGYHASALTVDLPENRVYWVGLGDTTCVESANSDGSDRKMLGCDGILWTLATIDVFQDYVYMEHWRGWRALRVNKTGGLVETALSFPWKINDIGIRVVHLDLQPLYPNQCGETNGGCRHLCLPTARLGDRVPSPTCVEHDPWL